MPVMRRGWTLAVLGALYLVPWTRIARLGDLGARAPELLLLWGVAHLLYLWAVIGVLSRRAERVAALPIVLGVGLLARFLLIPTPPTLSEDLYRYLWDGSLVAHGVNPYPHAPSDPALVRFRGELIHLLNHADVPTIYPPAAQLLFGAVARISATPFAWKITLLLLESLLVLGLLRLLKRRGLPGERLLLYYWNPLVLVESFGQGHVDLVAAAFLVTALWLYEANRPARAGIAFGLAVLSKWVPLLWAPWLGRRRAWVLLGAASVTCALLTLPFWGAGEALTTGLRIYARHWEFNGGLYRLMREVLVSDLAVVSDLALRRVFAVAGALATLAIAWKARSGSGALYASMVAFLLLSPTVFPWYAVPVLALLPLYPDPGMLFFSGVLALSYLPLPAYRATGVWSLPGWIVAVEYGGLLLAWGAAAVPTALRKRRDARAAGSGAGGRAGVHEREHADVEEPEQVENEKG